MLRGRGSRRARLTLAKQGLEFARRRTPLRIGSLLDEDLGDIRGVGVECERAVRNRVRLGEALRRIPLSGGRRGGRGLRLFRRW